jgi:hypothetical protein
MRLRWLSAALFYLALAAQVQAVYLGMSREALEREMGYPTSELSKGRRVILVYPKKVRIELEDDRVTQVDGMHADVEAPTPQPVPAEPTPAAATSPASSPSVPAGAAPGATSAATPSAAVPVPAAKTTAAAPATAAKPGPNSASAAPKAADENLLASVSSSQSGAPSPLSFDTIEKLDAQSTPKPAPPLAVNWNRITWEFILRLLIVGGVLWAVCKYWELNIEPKGILFATAIDAFVQVGLKVLAILALHISMLFYIDDGIATLVMMAVLHKLSFNKSTERTVKVALTTKGFMALAGGILLSIAVKLLSP